MASSDSAAQGFFSLAQANYKSLNRNRYGQDFYDQRMEATRRCCVQTSADAPPCVVPVPYRSSQAAGTEDQKQLVANDGNASKSDSVSQQPSPPATPPAKGEERDLTELAESGISKRDDSTPVEKNDASTRAEQAVKPRDPVQWFGILVPRELRSAQASFVSAVDDPSFIAVNAARGMREVEVEIRKVRKAVRKAERVHSG